MRRVPQLSPGNTHTHTHTHAYLNIVSTVDIEPKTKLPTLTLTIALTLYDPGILEHTPLTLLTVNEPRNEAIRNPML